MSYSLISFAGGYIGEYHRSYEGGYLEFFRLLFTYGGYIVIHRAQD